MPGPAIRMVNEDVELLSRDPIQGHWLPPPWGLDPGECKQTLLPLADVVKAMLDGLVSAAARQLLPIAAPINLISLRLGDNLCAEH